MLLGAGESCGGSACRTTTLTLFGTALMQRFAPRHPTVNLDLQSTSRIAWRRWWRAASSTSPSSPRAAPSPRGEVIRLERQVWCARPQSPARDRKLLCSHASFPTAAVARPQVLAALDAQERRWRIVHSSDLAGIQLAVASGDTSTVLPEAAVPPGWRRLGPEHGLPELPLLRLAVATTPQAAGGAPARRLPAQRVPEGGGRGGRRQRPGFSGRSAVRRLEPKIAMAAPSPTARAT